MTDRHKFVPASAKDDGGREGSGGVDVDLTSFSFVFFIFVLPEFFANFAGINFNQGQLPGSNRNLLGSFLCDIPPEVERMSSVYRKSISADLSCKA